MSAPNSAASGETLGRLAREDVPLLFDAVAVQADGSIVHTPRQTLNFAFDYHGATFKAEGRRVDGRLVVNVSADLGPLPFSAQSPQARRAIQDMTFAAAAAGAPRLTIAPDQTIRLESSFEMLQPVSPVGMLAEVTELLLALKPTLARMSEILTEASA